MLKCRSLCDLLLVFILAGCSNVPTSPQTNTTTVTVQEVKSIINNSEDELGLVFQSWQGVPYQLGGNSKTGVDCSAFVQIAFRDVWQIPLPRTTHSQSQTGRQVKYNSAQRGDLVFFKTSRTTNHVGVYLGNKKFMHASTSKGVMISRIDNPYWASKFWQFRRIMSPPNVN
ncbi:C40 family peptidase [Vibrio aestuarianus]|uniref:C40 family peptidase n=1 Tax=Vibrio aestuarianus TaxID=28171 RepID=UPI00237C6665|nr:NlpC/P60 family protein [Vibrio aestuarianus]MDE1339295.1 NlpC/P60 family protein [Vibrio aestuarianus]